MTLDEAREHVGAGVVYDPKYGPKEDGTIVAVSEFVVFVRYTGDVGPKGTYAKDLALLLPETK